MDFFGQQVGRERNQQVDQHRRTRFLAEAAPQPALEGGDTEGDRHAHRKAGHRHPQEGQRGRGQREGAGHHRRHRETEADQAGRIVEQRLAFQDVHQSLGNRCLGGDRADRHRVGRRDDGRQRKAHRQRHHRNHPVDQQAGTDDGEHHQAERQFEDRALVAEQTLLGDAPAIKEQQRRQEQQEEHFRLQRVAAVEHPAMTAPRPICTSGSGNENGRTRTR